MAKKSGAKAPKPERFQDRVRRARPPSFYVDGFTAEELALVAEFVSDPSLEDELWLQRVLNRRLLQESQVDDLKLLTKVVEVLGVGINRVAKLLRDKRALSGEAGDGLVGAIGKALDELSSELGFEL